MPRLPLPSAEVLGDVPCETRHEVLLSTPRSKPPYTPRCEQPRYLEDFADQDRELHPDRHRFLLTHPSQPRLEEVLREQARELGMCLNTFIESQKMLAGKLSSQQEHLIRLLEELSPNAPGARRTENQATLAIRSSMEAAAHDASHEVHDHKTCRFGDFPQLVEAQYGDPDAIDESSSSASSNWVDTSTSHRPSRIQWFLSDKSGQKVWNHMLRRAVSVLPGRYDFTKSSAYEAWMLFVILLHAAYIGWNVHYALTTKNASDDPYYGPFIFLGIYLFDLAARLYYERMRFFRGREKYWNLFDTCVMLVIIIELVLGWHFGDRDYKERNDVAVLRVLRVLRLIRFVNVFHFFFDFSREFRMLLHSSQKAIRAFFWLIFLILFMVYFVAIIMTQGALSGCRHGGNLARADPLCESFGSLDRAVLNLYLAIFGGVVWGELEAAAEALGLVFPLVIIFFVSFMHMILLNAVTGIVLEIHANTAQTEKLTMIQDTLHQKQDYIRKMQDIFATMDLNKNGGISVEEFQHALEDPVTLALLEKLDVEVKDAKQLFRMLDRDETGAIEIDEFIFGLMHMKGDAKAVDVLKLQIESEWMMHNISMIRQSLDQLCCNPARVSGKPARVPTFSEKPIELPSEVAMHVNISGHLHLIENTEERAMTLSDLRGVVAKINQACIQEDWRDMRTLKSLRPHNVNLYHFNWHCICPATSLQGVELKGLNLLHPASAGQKIVQIDTVSKVCFAEGISYGNGTADVLSVHLTKGRFQTLKEAAGGCVSIDGISVGAPDEITVKRSLSYKEFIHPTPTKAEWFCSHWWGEPVADFVESCVEHSRLRQIDINHAAYWICAYANRQHDIQDDLGCDPDFSSFRRAMSASKGVLLVLDSMATPFRRIWCDFELYHTLSDDKPLDIVTISAQGSKCGPQLLSQTTLPGETIFTKARREADFPIDLLVSGMRARLEDGEASHPADKPRILDSMARKQIRTSAVQTSYTKTDLEVGLERANGMLHSYLALAAWPQAVKKACVQDVDPQSPGTLCLPEILHRASHLHHFHLSLAHLKELHDADLELLSGSFPETACRIHLCFEGSANITDAGLTSLVEAFPANLQELSLDCVGCHRISDVGLKALALKLPEGLKKLDLFFATCPLIGMDGITALEECFPSRLRHFQGSFEGTQVDRKFSSVKEVTRFVASASRRPQRIRTSVSEAAGALVATVRNNL